MKTTQNACKRRHFDLEKISRNSQQTCQIYIIPTKSTRTDMPAQLSFSILHHQFVLFLIYRIHMGWCKPKFAILSVFIFHALGASLKCVWSFLCWKGMLSLVVLREQTRKVENPQAVYIVVIVLCRYALKGVIDQ